ncbi:MAG: NTP transferase domain-containing protein [Candidatus Diapherotrites archaeon]|uniref:glucose-1-phosphate thymidylyltransferase n=1 Tax=Candidatus Iainarchaeum sp. TaxID=3101447 RepID=A0A8T4KYW5_9ARCH|nr:MAG: glucose-1-phosphate thymidylyltransferase [archaeon GW2011_AR10]MBS3059274.1 NTP transferase domain-containing protein [Candidatus Diapherotrites archaeon]
MKGVILAGGHGTRLMPLTKTVNKHLLPVYNRPMIYYPIETLTKAGIKEILIVTGSDHAEGFSKQLGNGKEFGCNFTYELQDSAAGIADALRLAEDFADGEKIVVILGDNIFEDDISKYVKEFEKGNDEAAIFLKEVPDPHRFGVPELQGEKVLGIEEKPKKPKSNFAIVGLYMYDEKVFDIIKNLKPSARGEYEITDVNNAYLKKGKMKAVRLKGFWTDAGTFESLYRAAQLVKEKEDKKS